MLLAFCPPFSCLFRGVFLLFFGSFSVKRISDFFVRTFRDVLFLRFSLNPSQPPPSGRSEM